MLPAGSQAGLPGAPARSNAAPNAGTALGGLTNVGRQIAGGRYERSWPRLERRAKRHRGAAHLATVKLRNRCSVRLPLGGSNCWRADRSGFWTIGCLRDTQAFFHDTRAGLGCPQRVCEADDRAGHHRRSGAQFEAARLTSPYGRPRRLCGPIRSSGPGPHQPPHQQPGVHTRSGAVAVTVGGMARPPAWWSPTAGLASRARSKTASSTTSGEAPPLWR